MLDLSIIIPTIGRDTLADTLASVNGARPIVVYDREKKGGMGYKERNAGMKLASTKWIGFLDDDDVYASDAFEIIEAGLTELARPHIFQMRYEQENFFPAGHVLWTEPVLRYANVGTPMFVVPNIPDRLGTWRPYDDAGRGGDFAFIEETCGLMGDPVFCEGVIALIRPQPS